MKLSTLVKNKAALVAVGAAVGVACVTAASPTLGAFTASITNANNQIVTSNVAFTQELVDTDNLATASVMPGSALRTSVGGGSYATLEQPLFPELGSQNTDDSTFTFLRITNTGTTAASYNVAFSNLRYFKDGALTSDPAGTPYSKLMSAVDVQFQGRAGANVAPINQWQSTLDAVNSGAVAGTVNLANGGSPVTLELGAGKTIILTIKTTLDSAKFAANVNPAYDYAGVSAKVDLQVTATPINGSGNVA